jgi:hypothetical protein
MGKKVKRKRRNRKEKRRRKEKKNRRKRKKGRRRKEKNTRRRKMGRRDRNCYISIFRIFRKMEAVTSSSTVVTYLPNYAESHFRRLRSKYSLPRVHHFVFFS